MEIKKEYQLKYLKEMKNIRKLYMKKKFLKMMKMKMILKKIQKIQNIIKKQLKMSLDQKLLSQKK